jgi:hypothetical protein
MRRLLMTLVLAAVPAAPASVPQVAPQSIQGPIPRIVRVPVVVELFTSEGCSPCSPTDEFLLGLEQRQPIAGVEVIALEEHVDYWNGLGWRDPFSSRVMSNRQTDYNRLFNLDNISTPQLVIGGQAQVSGSDPARAREEIARAAKGPKASVEVSFRSASVATVKVEKLPADAPDSDIWMAVTEGGLASTIDGGENEGRTLRHTAVVRSIVIIGKVDTDAPTTYSMHLKFSPKWKRDELKYVVFVQDRVSKQIWGAAVVTP